MERQGLAGRKARRDARRGLASGGVTFQDRLAEMTPAEIARGLAQGAVQFLPAADIVDAQRNYEDAAGAALDGRYLDAVESFGWGALSNLGLSELSVPLSAMAGAGAASRAGRQAMGESAEAPRKGIRAYHGSPHDFDRFDMSKIGTGEGAQAYGHGLYFAENEDVARSYRFTGPDGAAARKTPTAYKGRSLDDMRTADRLRLPFGKQAILREARRIGATSRDGFEEAKRLAADRVRSRLDDLRKQLDETSRVNVRRRKALRANIDTTSRLLDEIKAEDFAEFSFAPGSMYEVNINADPDDFLDWDRPLSEQPRVAERLGGGSGDPQPAGVMLRRAKNNPMYRGDLIGQDTATPEELARGLAARGIPGVRYLDQGSRGAKEGTRNFVVFDDSLVEIVRKYGIAGLIAAGVAPEVIDQFIAENPEYAEQ